MLGVCDTGLVRQTQERPLTAILRTPMNSQCFSEVYGSQNFG